MAKLLELKILKFPQSFFGIFDLFWRDFGADERNVFLNAGNSGRPRAHKRVIYKPFVFAIYIHQFQTKFA